MSAYRELSINVGGFSEKLRRKRVILDCEGDQIGTACAAPLEPPHRRLRCDRCEFPISRKAGRACRVRGGDQGPRLWFRDRGRRTRPPSCWLPQLLRCAFVRSRSDMRGVGKGWLLTCSSRWSPI